MKKTKQLVAIALLLGISGCAPLPSNLKATYISPQIFQNLDCDEILMEKTGLQMRAEVLHAKLKQNITADAVNTGLAIITFGVTLLDLKGEGPEAVEYRQIKGQLEALEIVNRKKMCG